MTNPRPPAGPSTPTPPPGPKGGKAFDTTWYVPDTAAARRAELAAETAATLASITPGHVYVVEFDSGVVKVGKTINPPSRIATHAIHGQAHGRSIRSSWISRAHYFHGATERELIDFCIRTGECIAGREFFRITFEQARSRARLLSDNRMPYESDSEIGLAWQLAVVS